MFTIKFQCNISAPTADMIPNYGKANLSSIQQPMPKNDNQQYLGTMHTSLPPPSGGFPSNDGTVPPVPPFAFRDNAGRLHGQGNLVSWPNTATTTTTAAIWFYRSYNSPKQKFQRKQKKGIHGTAKESEYNVKEQTRKRRGFKSGFRVVNRAKLKLASSNAQKAKRERRNAEIELVEAKM